MPQTPEYKAALKAARDAIVNPYSVGDILYNSWGYDQTNIDFYQVVAKTRKTATLRKLSSGVRERGFMSGDTTPYPGSFVGEPFRKTLQVYLEKPWGSDSLQPCKPYIPMEHGSMSKWEGSPVNCSWYA